MQKKFFALTLVFALLLTLPACADVNQPITDVKAFEKQVFADYIEAFYADSYPHQRPTEVMTFRYYGTDNGYHIILFHFGNGVVLPADENVVIADRTFTIAVGEKLMAYKNGSFTDLRIAYRDGLISDEAVAKAAELHAEKKNATE